MGKEIKIRLEGYNAMDIGCLAPIFGREIRTRLESMLTVVKTGGGGSKRVILGLAAGLVAVRLVRRKAHKRARKLTLLTSSAHFRLIHGGRDYEGPTKKTKKLPTPIRELQFQKK